MASWATSKRERTLWVLSLAVAVAIYATLGFATALSEELTNRDLLDGVSALAFLVLLGVVLTVGFKGRAPRLFDLAVLVGLGAVYALVFLRIASPIERSHLFEYTLLAILTHEALLERRRNGGTVIAPALQAIGMTSAVGVLDEAIQLIIPSRVFDPVDIGFNVLAAFMGVTVSRTVEWVVRLRLAR